VQGKMPPREARPAHPERRLAGMRAEKRRGTPLARRQQGPSFSTLPSMVRTGTCAIPHRGSQGVGRASRHPPGGSSRQRERRALGAAHSPFVRRRRAQAPPPVLAATGVNRRATPRLPRQGNRTTWPAAWRNDAGRAGPPRAARPAPTGLVAGRPHGLVRERESSSATSDGGRHRAKTASPRRHASRPTPIE